MKIKRHKAEVFNLLGIQTVLKDEFLALHLSKREQSILFAAAKVAGEARKKMAIFANQDFSDWDTQFASIEHSALDIAEMKWIELDVDTG